MAKAGKPKQAEKRAPARLGDVVCWYAIKAAAAAICGRLRQGGQRAKLAVGKSYPVSLRVTGLANGTAIDEEIAGRVVRDEDKKTSRAPGAADLLAEALTCVAESERTKVADRLKKGTAKPTDATRALAEAVLAARKTDATRAGDVHLTPSK